MKKSALAALGSLAVGALLAVAPARAELVTIEYSVPVASIVVEYLNPYHSENVFWTSAPGFETYVGDPITGTYTYDDRTVLQLDGTGGAVSTSGNHRLTFFLSGTNVQLDGRLATGAAAGGAFLGVSGNDIAYADPSAWMSVDFALEGPAFGDLHTLPTAAELRQFAASTSRRFTVTVHTNEANIYLTGGDMAVQVSAVPEPATIAMTLAGLAVVAAAARRRRETGAPARRSRAA